MACKMHRRRPSDTHEFMSLTRVAVAVLSAAILLSLAAAVQSRGAAGPVYTVEQVKAGLAHHPSAWIGRTIRVKGGMVLALWPYARLNGPNGLSYLLNSDGCTELPGCMLHVPAGQVLHLFLVPDSGRERPAEIEAVRVGLLVQRVYQVRLAAPLTFCSQGPVCDDGVLLGSL